MHDTKISYTWVEDFQD